MGFTSTLYCSILSSLLFFIVVVNGNYCEITPSIDGLCPNTTLTTNGNSLRKLQNSIYTGLLNRKISRWSNEAQKLRNIVNSRLISSEILEEYTFAHTFTTWMAIYQKLFESGTPSDCGLKSAIRAMRECIEDSVTFAVFPKNDIIQLYDLSAYYLFFDALTSIGCSELKPVGPNSNCEGKSTFLYDMNILWNSTNLPSDLKENVKNLSVSKNFADKFLSVLATFSILKSTNIAVENMNQLEYLELINFMNGPKVIPQCCFPMRNRLAELTNKFVKVVSKGINNIETFFKESGFCGKKFQIVPE